MSTCLRVLWVMPMQLWVLQMWHVIDWIDWRISQPACLPARMPERPPASSRAHRPPRGGLPCAPTRPLPACVPVPARPTCLPCFVWLSSADSHCPSAFGAAEEALAYISSAFAATEGAYAAARGSGCKTAGTSSAGSVTMSSAPGFRRVDASPQAVMAALRNEGPVIVYFRAGASLAGALMEELDRWVCKT